MSATRDGKMWRCQFYYKDWQGVSHKKNKRGFKTKAEAEQWERDFLQQQQRNLDINFENFVQIYYEDMVSYGLNQRGIFPVYFASEWFLGEKGRGYARLSPRDNRGCP